MAMGFHFDQSLKFVNLTCSYSTCLGRSFVMQYRDALAIMQIGNILMFFSDSFTGSPVDLSTLSRIDRSL
jgi:hypothetical protein